MIHKLTSSSSPVPETPVREVSSHLGVTYWLSWIPAVLMVAWLGYVALLKVGVVEAARTNLDRQVELAKVLPANAQSEAQLPELAFTQPVSVSRVTELDTLVPSRPRTEPQKYVVQAGDSVFSIAKQFNLKPETVLWANYNLLNDNPNMLSIGQELLIPAVDGVLYEPKPGEAIEDVAKKFKATPEDIISWPANKIDVADPKLVAGQTIMIPNGQREMRSWVVPTI
ncbi:LysM peptidoglycan-binding domain-containing protein, partial [Anaerolinea sp.]|uniref:LysM peptidoglycan-binding domain-containing protein n=1 Tax=Anaerolinea sp. TaxID=1872519 RepID=UPI002ACE274D